MGPASNPALPVRSESRFLSCVAVSISQMGKLRLTDSKASYSVNDGSAQVSEAPKPRQIYYLPQNK